MSKEVNLPELGRVILTKRRSSIHIRLRVAHDGSPRVSLPIWVSYDQAIKFVTAKSDWVRKQQIGRTTSGLKDGQRVGKSHFLRIVQSKTNKINTRIAGNEAIVRVPSGQDPQAAAERVALKALKKESEALLPQRLRQLAELHGFEYNQVKIAKMRSRWGSCNSQKLITLNCYLIQLPWHLIDYVLLHELTHTKIMAHSEDFWDMLSTILPDVKQRRKELKTYHTSILTVQA